MSFLPRLIVTYWLEFGGALVSAELMDLPFSMVERIPEVHLDKSVWK